MSLFTLTPIWHLDFDPLATLVGLAYAVYADKGGWMTPPDIALVCAMTGLPLRTVPRQLLRRANASAPVGRRRGGSERIEPNGRARVSRPQDQDDDLTTWGSRVAAEGR